MARPASRAMQVARSVGQGSCRGGKGGVRTGHTTRLSCIHPAIEAFGDEQPLLVLLVVSGMWEVKRPLMFVHVPRVLVAGPIDTDGLRTISWAEQPP